MMHVNANDVFLSIYQKIFTCKICEDSVTCGSQSRILNILPIENHPIEQLMEHSMSQVVHKIDYKPP